MNEGIYAGYRQVWLRIKLRDGRALSAVESTADPLNLTPHALLVTATSWSLAHRPGVGLLGNWKDVSRELAAQDL